MHPPHKEVRSAAQSPPPQTPQTPACPSPSPLPVHVEALILCFPLFALLHELFAKLPALELCNPSRSSQQVQVACLRRSLPAARPACPNPRSNSLSGVTEIAPSPCIARASRPHISVTSCAFDKRSHFSCLRARARQLLKRLNECGTFDTHRRSRVNAKRWNNPCVKA